MKTRVEQFHQYCINTGMPDTVHGFALWNAWEDCKDEKKELTRGKMYFAGSEHTTGVKGGE